jgi:hypothetical protein
MGFPPQCPTIIWRDAGAPVQPSKALNIVVYILLFVNQNSSGGKKRFGRTGTQWDNAVSGGLARRYMAGSTGGTMRFKLPGITGAQLFVKKPVNKFSTGATPHTAKTTCLM